MLVPITRTNYGAHLVYMKIISPHNSTGL